MLARFQAVLVKAGAKKREHEIHAANLEDGEYFGWDEYGNVDHWMIQDWFTTTDDLEGRLLTHSQVEMAVRYLAEREARVDMSIPSSFEDYEEVEARECVASTFVFAPIHDAALVNALTGFSYPMPDYRHFAKGWSYSIEEIKAAHRWVSGLAGVVPTAPLSVATTEAAIHPTVEALNSLPNLPSRIRREITSLRALRSGAWSGSTLNPDMTQAERNLLKDGLDHAISNLNVALNHAEYASKSWSELPKRRFVTKDMTAPVVDDSAMLDEAVESELSTSDALFG